MYGETRSTRCASCGATTGPFDAVLVDGIGWAFAWQYYVCAKDCTHP